MLSLSPTFSTTPSGSYSRVSSTVVRVGLSSTNRTAPALVAPEVAAQAIFWSGTCSRMVASHSRCPPPISATQCRVLSPCWRTSLMPPMNWGKSSNCVHWL